MKKNQLLHDIRIEKIVYGGVWLATLPTGKKVLIKWGALPGSVVDCRIVKKKKDHIQAHIVMIKEYDKQYADWEVFCPHYFVPISELQADMPAHKIGCGWCKWQVMSYPKQLAIKESIVAESFQSFDWITTYPIIPSPQVKGYRNKIEFSFGKYISHKQDIHTDWNLGFHKQGEFSKIIDIDSCGLVSSQANTLFEYLKKLLLESGLPVYDQKMHTGVLRHLVIREGVNTEQFLINLVVSDANFTDAWQTIWEAIQEKIKSDSYLKKTVTTFVVTYNNGIADIVRDRESKTVYLWWDGYIYDKLVFPTQKDEVSLNFRISPFSFFQTNTLGAQQLFWHAAKHIQNIKWTILDVYCGAGSIWLSLLWMGIGNSMVGVEIVEDAVTDAWHNAEINGLKSQSLFFAGKAEKLFVDYPQVHEKLDDLWLIVVDPPRDGLHKDVISFVSNLHKKYGCKILYISCNPVTMARDCRLFADVWIQTKLLQPVDMFPHTHHIETIWLLH